MRWNPVSLPFLTVLAMILWVAFAVPGVAAPQQPAPPQTAPPQPAPKQASGPPTYVGSEMCASCHADVADNLAKTPHGKSVFGGLSSHGCETCHGPGSKHVENPDVVENQPVITKMSAWQVSETCQSCHKGGNQFFWHGSVHDTRGLSCVSCHSIHAFKSEKAQLKAINEVETCVTCHKTVRAEMWKSSHHPIREGKISCSDCHNPHGSTTPKLIKQASVNDQCYTCHTEKRGPFLWEHAPVRENCLNCHSPHGSNHLKLQKTSVPYLCQQCHANTRHPGTLYDGTTLADAGRASNRLFNRSCLDCHASIHGSNHPSSPYLGH